MPPPPLTIPHTALLTPLSLPQYTAALLTNLSHSSNPKELSVAKLKTLRLQHLSQMGITDFAHQKSLTARIKLIISELSAGTTEGGEYEFLKEVDREMENEEEEEERRQKVAQSKGRRGSGTRTERKSFERRASFDRKAQMGKINGMRSEVKGDSKAAAVNKIRKRSFENEKGKTKSDIMKDVEKNMLEDEHAEARLGSRPARKSLSEKTEIGMRFNSRVAEIDKKAQMKERAQQYGNCAQRAAKADDGLAKIGVKVMKEFKDEIDCDRCSLLFFDSLQNEMFFYSHDQRFKFSMDKGIAGYVAMTEELVNVPDAYADSRFNQEMDKQTGFKTRNILCAPIRARSGDGVVAVIQMLNKKGDLAFSTLDEEVIRNASFKVSEALDLQFSTLINAQIDMERMSLDGARGEVTHSTPMAESKGGDERPLAEDSRLMTVASGTNDGFAEERRKRQKEYGMEVREAKIGI